MCTCEFECECAFVSACECVCVWKGELVAVWGCSVGGQIDGEGGGKHLLSQLVREPLAVGSSNSVRKFQMATLLVTFVLLSCDGRMLNIFGSISTPVQKQVTSLELCASTSNTLIDSVDRSYWKDSGEMKASQMVWTFKYSEGPNHCACFRARHFRSSLSFTVTVTL